MKFSQIVLLFAAAAQAAVISRDTADTGVSANPAVDTIALRDCRDRCLDDERECDRHHRSDHHCDEEFRRCEERCHHEHDHDHDHDHGHY